MLKLIIFFSLFICPLTTWSAIPPKLEPRNLDAEVLFHWNDLKETEDQLHIFQLEEQHQTYELELAQRKFEIDQKLHAKQAITNFELMKSKSDVQVKAANLEAASLKIKEQLIALELKKLALEAKQSKKVSLKKIAQLYSDDWKAKYNLGLALVRQAQAELDFVNYHYETISKLNDLDVSALEEILEVTQQKKEKEASVKTLSQRLVTLLKTSNEAQKVADELKD
jgi:multidrug resistance efflux pump